MDYTLPGDLPALWRARAETLSTYGDPTGSRIWNIAATELERAMESSAAETLTVADASRITGYSRAYLGALIKHKKIPNAASVDEHDAGATDRKRRSADAATPVTSCEPSPLVATRDSAATSSAVPGILDPFILQQSMWAKLAAWAVSYCSDGLSLHRCSQNDVR
jgi:hypothetical protein